MKHKHYDLILAWANGAKIQFKSSAYPKWTDVSNPAWDIENEYRIKPVPTHYRMYKRQHHPDSPMAIRVAKLGDDDQWVEESDSFQGWIGDWVEDNNEAT